MGLHLRRTLLPRSAVPTIRSDVAGRKKIGIALNAPDELMRRPSTDWVGVAGSRAESEHSGLSGGLQQGGGNRQVPLEAAHRERLRSNHAS